MTQQVRPHHWGIPAKRVPAFHTNPFSDHTKLGKLIVYIAHKKLSNRYLPAFAPSNCASKHPESVGYPTLVPVWRFGWKVKNFHTPGLK